MLRTLSGKLAALLFIALTLIVGAYGAMLLQSTRTHLDEANQTLNKNLARYLVDANKLVKGDAVNQRGLAKLFANLMSVNPNIEIYLLDTNGTILSYSAAAERVKRTSIDIEPVRQFVADTAMFPLMGDDPRDLTRRKVFSAAPLPATGTADSYLYVVLGGEDYDSVTNMIGKSQLLRMNIAMAVLLAALVVVAWFLMFKSITSRVRKLNDRVERFRRDMPVTKSLPAVTPVGGDEIDQLNAAFEQMSQRIAQQVEDLKQVDRLRRELVANVSHDLRTPLTALHGYLETLLLKGAELTPPQQREYLETAARSSQRLRKLVSELFELAKLESREVPTEFEPFSIRDLIQDVVEEFQLLARQNDVRLKAKVQAEANPVLGDIEMIERVLQNLIQNAIHHTPAGGLVTVELEPIPGGVEVSITDTGCGIPQQDLPYIFDRFYRARSSPATNADGTGLGLAIAKRCIELHGTSIKAESTINSGATISFTLKTTSEQVSPAPVPTATTP